MASNYERTGTSREGPEPLQVPDSWAEPYAALAEEMDFPVTDVGDAAAQAREFISKIDAS